jgi:hypothetical protein
MKITNSTVITRSVVGVGRFYCFHRSRVSHPTEKDAFGYRRLRFFTNVEPSSS